MYIMTQNNRPKVGFFASSSQSSLTFSCNNFDLHVLSSLDQFVQKFKILNFSPPASSLFFLSVVFEAAALVHFLGKYIRLYQLIIVDCFFALVVMMMFLFFWQNLGQNFAKLVMVTTCK